MYVLIQILRTDVIISNYKFTAVSGIIVKRLDKNVIEIRSQPQKKPVFV